MNNNMSVSLSDYAHGSGGFGQDEMNAANFSAEQLGQLSKAMEAGQLQGGDLTGQQTNAGALKVESLESSLKLITFRESDIRFWRRFPKKAAFNTVEEYNQLTSYGQARGGFNLEGELPEEEDSQYVRKAEHVKFMGVTRSVTHPAQLVKMQIGNLKAQETTNGIRYILQKADRALFYGDEKVVQQEWNGLYAQHMNNDAYANLKEYMDSELVVDLRGKTLKEADIDNASTILLRAFGHASLLVAPPVVLSDFAKGFYARQRQLMGGSTNGNVSGVTAGNHVSKFQSQYGLIDFEYDIFAAKPPAKLPTGGATSAKAPVAPTAVGTTIITTDGDTKFADGAGDYYYAVSSINRYGESAMTQVGAVVTVAANESVDLEFTATAGPYMPTAYVIYRSKKDGTTSAFNVTSMYPIMTVPASGNDTKRGSLLNGVDNAPAGQVRDNNRWIPGTEEAILSEGTSDIMEFKQLAPIMKMDLARLSPADRWMVLLYGTPILYQPTKMVRFINIGREA